MYISLYTARQLEQIREKMLWLGLFMLSGGLASLLYNLMLQEGVGVRWYWAAAACIVAVSGAVFVALGTGKLQLKEAYFSITPVMISYRLHLFSQERMIYWQQVTGVQVSERYVLFDLNSGGQVLLRLSSLQSDNVARHVATSLQTTALERNISVNGVRFTVPKPTSEQL